MVSLTWVTFGLKYSQEEWGLSLVTDCGFPIDRVGQEGQSAFSVKRLTCSGKKWTLCGENSHFCHNAAKSARLLYRAENRERHQQANITSSLDTGQLIIQPIGDRCINVQQASKALRNKASYET